MKYGDRVPGEGPPRDATRFSVLKKNRVLHAAFLSLTASGRAIVMDHAKAKARHRAAERGLTDQALGFGLMVMTARNEYIEMELGPFTGDEDLKDFPRSSEEAHEETWTKGRE